MYCMFCGAILPDDVTICRSCGLQQKKIDGMPISSSVPQAVEPRVIPRPDETPRNGSDPASPSLVGSADQAPVWETCEIMYERRGSPSGRFVARAKGPQGEYVAGKSLRLTGAAYFKVLEGLNGAEQDGPSSRDPMTGELLKGLMTQLVQDGWILLGQQGEHWWSKRFRRRHKPRSLPREA